MANKENLFQTKLVKWIDEKITWRSYLFMRWYCYHYFKSKCYSIGKNFELEYPVRKPIIRGGGKIKIGDNVTILGKVELMANTGIFKSAKISIGNNTKIGNNTMFSACKSIEVKENCLIGRYVSIYDNNGHALRPQARLMNVKMEPDEIQEITIGNNVWIGHFSHIQKGVKIGDNSIIASNSVVAKDIQPNVIVMGIPARVCGWLDKNLKINDINTMSVSVKMRDIKK